MSGSGYGSNTLLERRVTDLERERRKEVSGAGMIASIGTLTLTNDGVSTTTVVSDSSVTASSLIATIPVDDGALSPDGATRCVPASGSFTAHHAAATITRTHKYFVINPA
jgi:hypothetical protein